MKKLMILGSLMFVGCGSGGGGGSSPAPTTPDVVNRLTLAVNEEFELGSCSSVNQNQLAYVISDSKFYKCDNALWTQITIKEGKNALIVTTDELSGDKCSSGGIKIASGTDNNDNGSLEDSELSAVKYVCNGNDGEKGLAGKDGAKGSDGLDGFDGADGQDGTDNRIVASFLCQGTINSSNNQGLSVGNGINFSYSVAKMASGDIFVTGTISNASEQTSQTQFYSSQQNGAQNASVTITDDYYGSMGYGWWELSVNIQTGIPTAVFNDPSMPTSSTRTWTFTACTVNNY